MSAKCQMIVLGVLSLVASSVQQTTSPKPAQGICYQTLDLVFIIDGSNSLGPDHFKTIITTVADAVEVLTIDQDDARVGAVLFSNNVTAKIDLQTNKKDFQNAVRLFDFPDASTFTNLGIDEAVTILTSHRRENVPLTIMIITDGVSTDRQATRRAAEKARNEGIDIWAVGIGNDADLDELAEIATNGFTQTFDIANFTAVPDRLVKLTHLVCENTTVIPTQPATTPTPPPRPENPYIELCKDSPSIGGVGHARYPGDCTKLLQCYYNHYTNKTLVVTRQCPSGQFWDQDCLKCASSWTVNCPYDKCRLTNCSSCMSGAETTYPMDGVCGGFWSCEKGKSYPKCCPPCYSYMPGYGCKFGTTCYDKCGPQEECLSGLGMCDKIPVWENMTDYATVTDMLGMTRTTCSRSEFNILQCRCDLRLMDIFMQDSAECQPYYESNSTMECNSGLQMINIKQNTDIGIFAFEVGITLTEPMFKILSAPSSSCVQCDNSSKITIWSDMVGIHASLGDPPAGGTEAAVLMKGFTGYLEISITLKQGVLTLAVRQDQFQAVSAVRARSQKLCNDCVHEVTATAASRQNCTVNELKLYNCRPSITNIYSID